MKGAGAALTNVVDVLHANATYSGMSFNDTWTISLAACLATLATFLKRVGLPDSASTFVAIKSPGRTSARVTTFVHEFEIESFRKIVVVRALYEFNPSFFMLLSTFVVASSPASSTKARALLS
jgi:hypothetical protein